jgi:hypothetical protein
LISIGQNFLVEQLVLQATPILLQNMKDDAESVRDISVWAIANIVKVFGVITFKNYKTQIIFKKV